MHIQATIKTFKPYTALFQPKHFKTYSLADVRAGTALLNSSFMLTIGTSVYAVSKWTGPKRTRTYPYQHVYDTINHKPKVTLIPFVKDEGIAGDRDFIQWDTISLMTLLNVYVILTYHVSARKSGLKGALDKQKISEHRLDSAYIAQRLEELAVYQSDPLHWNLKELSKHLPYVLEQTMHYQARIEQSTGVQLHRAEGLRQRYEALANFETDSRLRAQAAQSREQGLIHAGEQLAGAKASITIKNYYNGAYYFTVDEAIIQDGDFYLIEKKHGKNILPAIADIKDGLLKLMLYQQLDTAEVDSRSYPCYSVLGLTSTLINGYIHSAMAGSRLENFWAANPKLSKTQQQKVDNLFYEARQNKFFAYLVNSTEEVQVKEEILADFSNSK